MRDDEVARALSLLSIVEKCAGHPGRLSALSARAMAELLDMNSEFAAPPQAPAQTTMPLGAEEVPTNERGEPEDTTVERRL